MPATDRAIVVGRNPGLTALHTKNVHARGRWVAGFSPGSPRYAAAAGRKTCNPSIPPPPVSVCVATNQKRNARMAARKVSPMIMATRRRRGVRGALRVWVGSAICAFCRCEEDVCKSRCAGARSDRGARSPKRFLTPNPWVCVIRAKDVTVNPSQLPGRSRQSASRLAASSWVYEYAQPFGRCQVRKPPRSPSRPIRPCAHTV